MRRGLKILVWTLAVVLLGAAVAAVSAFVYKNSGSVVVRVPEFSGDWNAPVRWSAFDLILGAGLAGSFVTGAVVVLLLVMLPSGLRRSFDQRRQGRFIRDLEGELSALRNLPVTDPAPYEDVPDMQGDGLDDDSSAGDPWADLDDDAALIAALGEDEPPQREKRGEG